MSLADRLVFLALGLILTGWLYGLTFKVLQCLTRAEEALDLADRILWALQQRMATRGLTAWLTEPEPQAPAAEPEPEAPGRRARGRLRLRLRLARVAARAPELEPATIPDAAGPSTVTTGAAIDIWQQTATPVRIESDDVDRQLARFDYAPGHHRHEAARPSCHTPAVTETTDEHQR